MNAARASHPSRIKRVVSRRAPLPFRGCPRGIRRRLTLREECLPAAVAGLMPAHRLRPSQFSLAKEPCEGVFCTPCTEMRSAPDAFRSHPRRDCVSRPPRDVCPRASGHSHASSVNTLPEARTGHKRDSRAFCAKAVGSGNMLWKIEEKTEEKVPSEKRADILSALSEFFRKI
jgi:hypothetical protein